MSDAPTANPDQIPADVLAEASAAARDVFDRAMHLYSPNQAFLDEAIAAAGAVFARALDFNIGRRAELSAAALNIRDMFDGAQARLRAAHEKLATDDFDQDSCTTLETTINTVLLAYRNVADSEAAAAARIQHLRRALRDAAAAARSSLPLGTIAERAETALLADQS